MKNKPAESLNIQCAKPILYYVFLTPQETRAPKPVIDKFEAQGWTFLKRRFSHTTQKIGLVFQRPFITWAEPSSISHPFQISQSK